MHAIFYHWLMNDSVLFWLAFAMLGKIRRQYGLIFNLVVVCVLPRWDISVYVQAQTRSMLPYLTSFKHTLLYFSQSVQKQNLPRVLCVFTDSLFPLHILRLFLTVLLSTLPSHTDMHSHTHYPPLVLLGSPPGTNFPTFLPLVLLTLCLLSHSADCSPGTRSLSSVSGTSIWGERRAEVQLEKGNAHITEGRLCVFLCMYVLVCV